MKKQLIVTTIAAGSLLGSVTTVGAQEQATNVTKPTSDAPITTEVKSVETTTVAKPVTNEEVPAAKTESVKPVSQQDVDAAKEASDKSNQDVAKQKAVVSEKQNQLQDAEKTATDFKTQAKEVESVTPEKVAEAKDDADAKAKTVTSAVESVQSAEKSVSATSEKVANQAKVVKGAEETATAATDKVENAQKKVDGLSSSTDITKLEGDVYGLSNQVDVDTKAVETAQEKLDDGKKALTNKEEALKEAQQKVDAAEEVLNQAKTAHEEADALQSSKEEDLNKAKSALEVAKQGVTVTTSESETFYNIPKATYAPALSQGYLDAIKALADGSGTSEAVDSAVYEVPYTDPNTGESADSLSDFNSTGSRTEKGQSIPYGAEDTDDTEIVDFQHLTKDQQVKLSIYAASIINELRAKVGTKPVTVGDTSLQLAEAFNNNANGYTTGTGGEYNPLNTQDLKLNDKLNMAKESTNTTGSALAIRTSSIPHFLDLNENLTTMARIKQVLYTGIVNTLMGGESNTGSEDRFSGALSLLGLKDEDKTNLGVGLGAMVSQLNKGYEASFTLSAPQDNVTTTQKVDEEAVEKAQNEYTEAYKAYKEAEDAALLANSRYNDAKDALYFARNDLSDIKMGNIDLEELETKLAEAKDKLAKDTEALQTAKEVLAIAKSNATDVATALKQAKEELKTAKSEKATADETLATAKSELEVLTKENTMADLALTKANKELDFARTESQEATKKFNLLNSALTNREAVLKDLGTKLSLVESRIATIRAELETAKEELTRLEGISKAKEEDYLKVKSLKDAQDKAEAEAKRLKELQEAEAKRLKELEEAEAKRLQDLKDKEAQIKADGGVVTPVFDASGKVVDYTDGRVQETKKLTVNTTTKFTQSESSKTATKFTDSEGSKTANAQLPETGTTSSTWVSALGIALASVGFVGFGLKRKEEN
mgnify:CR=1 FL=1